MKRTLYGSVCNYLSIAASSAMPTQPLSQTPTQPPPQTQLPTTTGLPPVPGVSAGVIVGGVIAGLIGVAIIIIIIIIIIVYSIWKYSPSKCDYRYYYSTCSVHMYVLYVRILTARSEHLCGSKL